MEYEINYLILQSKTSRLREIRREVKKIIESAGAKIKNEKEFLKRKLAYEINKEKFGFYTVLRLEIEEKYQEAINKIKRKMNLASDVARYIIINAEELPSLEALDYKQEDQERKEQTEKEREGEDRVKKGEAEKIVAEDKKKFEEAPERSQDLEKENEKAEDEKNTILDEKEEEGKEISQEDAQKQLEGKKKKEGKKEKDSKKKKDDRVSLDELDDKLDEILNI